MSVIDYRRKLIEVSERVRMIDLAFDKAAAKAGDPTEEVLEALVDTFFDVKYRELQAKKAKLLAWLRMDKRHQGGEQG